MKKGDRLIVRVDDVGYDGKGIAHAEGFTVFIPFALDEEIVEIEIEHVKKGIAFSKLLRIKKKSPKRRQPFCDIYEKCGGCSFMHINYADQLLLKEKNLKTILYKNAKYDGNINPIVGSEETKYRNKIQLPFRSVNGKAEFGFYEENTHNVVALSECFLHGDWAERLVKLATDFTKKFKIEPYDELSGKGLLRHLVARYIGNTLTVTLVINGEKIKGVEDFRDALLMEFSSVSLYLSVNKVKNNVIMGDKLIPIYAKKQVVNIDGIDIEVNPHSFFQINDYIRDKVYKRVIEEINPNEDSIIVDAFSGVGLLGAIAAKHGAYVYNIEIVKEATKDADKLYQNNGLTHCVKNINDDAARALPKLLKDLEGTNKQLTVILDPPRKGVDESVVDALLQSKTKFKLIYISCSPPTLSRDLALLLKKFKILEITPFDMFPNTHHVETLVILGSFDG